jgi:hypothetical protein
MAQYLRAKKSELRRSKPTGASSLDQLIYMRWKKPSANSVYPFTKWTSGTFQTADLSQTQADMSADGRHETLRGVPVKQAGQEFGGLS